MKVAELRIRRTNSVLEVYTQDVIVAHGVDPDTGVQFRQVRTCLFNVVVSSMLEGGGRGRHPKLGLLTYKFNGKPVESGDRFSFGDEELAMLDAWVIANKDVLFRWLRGSPFLKQCNQFEDVAPL